MNIIGQYILLRKTFFNKEFLSEANIKPFNLKADGIIVNETTNGNIKLIGVGAGKEINTFKIVPIIKGITKKSMMDFLLL